MYSQLVHVGLSGGMANYNGDLLDKLYVRKQTNGFISVNASYELMSQVMIRAGLTYARVNGDDLVNSKPNLQRRNLRFESVVAEFSVVAELFLFNLDERRLSPYLFAGLAVFYFNPYTYDASLKKVFLKPLSTEGQGIYPGNNPYSLVQPALPFGGGFRWAVSDNLRIGVELGLRKLFTDHLDDVSGSYPDYNDLLNSRGQQAVDLSYREDEYPGGSPFFPTKDTQRGGSEQKDYYYFTGIHATYRIGGGSGLAPIRIGGKNKLGCPTVVY